MGITDDRIIFFNSMDISADPRNVAPGSIFNDEVHSKNIYQDVQFDYVGDDVTVDSFIRLLTGRYHNWTPISKQLNSDQNSKVLIFMSGHGGYEFFKFQDREELTALQLANAFQEMHIKQRYSELILILDTCQASTLANYIKSPNIFTISSSMKGQNSYSYVSSPEIGAALIDRFSHALNMFFHDNYHPRSTFQDVMSSLDPHFLHSTPAVVSTNCSRGLSQIYLSEYFGSSKLNFVENIIEFTSLDDPFVSSTAAFVTSSEIVSSTNLAHIRAGH